MEWVEEIPVAAVPNAVAAVVSPLMRGGQKGEELAEEIPVLLLLVSPPEPSLLWISLFVSTKEAAAAVLGEGNVCAACIDRGRGRCAVVVTVAADAKAEVGL